jgi:tetratricopeptide (TPR) repeat protein
MTKASFFSAVAVAGLLLASRVCAAPATPAMIAEVQAALDKGDAQQAALLADAALADGATAAERGRLLLYRGLALELLGAHGEAMRDFTQALGTHALLPDERAQALLQRGFLRDGLGRLQEAASDYTAVIALQGDGLATALNNRANIYRRQRQLAQAKWDYLAALSAGGGKAQYSYYGLGQIAESEHDPVAARGFYTSAVAADPGYGLAAERLAALGGPPDGALADDMTPVILHPPAARAKAADTVDSVRAATEARKELDGTIVLQASDTTGETIVLRRPGAQLPHGSGPAVRSSPANMLRSVHLRPALDQPVSQGPEVQLGAWRSEAEANAGWDKAKARADGALEGLKPHIVTADLPGKGRYYRLRVRPAQSQSQTEFCAILAAKDLACLPVRN